MNTPNNDTITVGVPRGMRVLVVHNDGQGDAGYKEVPVGTRAGDVLPGCKNRILVNGKLAELDTVLQNNDKVSENPTNIEGA